MKAKTAVLNLVAVLCLLAAGGTWGKVIYVDDDASTGGDGTSWTTAYRFLQDALGQAEVGDEVRVAQGTYRPDESSASPQGSGDRKASFVLPEGVTAKGGFAGLTGDVPNAWDASLYETVLSGDLDGNDVALDDPADFRDDLSRDDNSLAVVTAGASTVLEGFTITAGHAQPYRCFGRDCPDVVPTLGFNGGGVLIREGDVTVRSCRLHHNFAAQEGGGVFVHGVGGVLLEDCVLERNGAYQGGGEGLFVHEGTAEIEGCELLMNWGRSEGGGLGTRDSDITISDCLIRRNEATSYGGGLSVFEGNATLWDTIIAGNRSDGGGGQFAGADVMLRGCSITNNRSRSTGGGGHWVGATVLATGCLFSGNSAQEYGGALWTTQCEPLQIMNSTFVSNRATCGAFLSSHQDIPYLTSNSVSIVNCIVLNGGQEIHNNQTAMTVRYTLINRSDASAYDAIDTIVWGDGNINVDPCFADAGYWDPNGTPDDPNDDFFVEGDYHLKSQAGRWDAASGSWVQDDVTSPCIDAGDPNSPIGYEPFPNGGVVNMGAYGGTAQASKSYFGEPVCETIIAGDINGDGKVDWLDLSILASHWLQDVRESATDEDDDSDTSGTRRR
jgi:predicted outer membrane repeat protein